MSRDLAQVEFGDDPSAVGRCLAITFVLDRKGSKPRIRTVQRQEFKTGLEAKAACQSYEAEYSTRYNAPSGTIYFDADSVPPDYVIERSIVRELRV